MRKKMIGTIPLQNRVSVCDPFMDKDFGNSLDSLEIRRGTYACYAYYMHTDNHPFTPEVGMIGIYHNGNIPDSSEMELISTIDVENGLAGFFDHPDRISASDWPKFWSDIMSSEAVVSADGFFSQTGNGDSCYHVLGHFNGNQLDAIELYYLYTYDSMYQPVFSRKLCPSAYYKSQSLFA